MTPQQIRQLFEQVQRGKLTPDAAVEQLKHLPFEDLGFAKIDHHRMLRQGMPETVYGPGKTPQQIVAIVRQMLLRSPNILVTRASRAAAGAVRRLTRAARFYPLSGAVAIHRDRTEHGKGKILVISAGKELRKRAKSISSSRLIVPSDRGKNVEYHQSKTSIRIAHAEGRTPAETG